MVMKRGRGTRGGRDEQQKESRWTRRSAGEKDEKVAGTYVRYAGEKHPGGAPAVPPTFKVRVASEQAPRAPGGPAINSRLGSFFSMRSLSVSRSLSLFLSFSSFSPAAYSHAIHDSRGIERPRGHTPSSREPAGRKRGAHGPPRAPLSAFEASAVIVARRGLL